MSTGLVTRIVPAGAEGGSAAGYGVCLNSRMVSANGDNAFDQVFTQDMMVSVLVA